MAIGKSLTYIRSLTPTERTALKKIGIDNTEELLQAAKNSSAERALAKKAGVSVAAVREAVNRADLLRVGGIGASRADFFENAGVNSAAELAQRNAASLRATLERAAKTSPEANVVLPSSKTLASLIEKAKALKVEAPAATVDAAKAREVAGEALHKYIDNVLFTDAEEGESFREAILAWRPKSEWPKVQQQMHEDVANFVRDAEKSTDKQIPGSYWFSGRLFQLYTEVTVDKTGKVLNTYVEID